MTGGVQMTSQLIWVALLALCGLSTAAGRCEAKCDLEAVAVLPLTLEHDRFLINADINGHSAKLILATGYFATALDLKAADALGVSMARTDREIYGVGGNQHMYRGTVSRMRIGPLNADNAVLVGADMWGADAPTGWSGRFGMNMMAGYDLDLDVVGGHAVFLKAKGDCNKPHVALGPELYTVPLETIREDRQADIIVNIDGHRIKAMLDSGAPHTILYRSAANRLGVDLSPMRAPGHATIVGNGKYPVGVMQHRFGTVSIGDLQLNNMDVRIIDQESNGIDRTRVGSLLPDTRYDALNGEEMLIGVDFMRQVHLWISHSSQTVIMQFPPKPSDLPH